MKQRIKIDSFFVVLLIFSTGFLCMNKQFYGESRVLDNILDFLGMVIILKAVLLRMSARGHKKAHSQQSQQIVSTGPYTLTRNPMYLGSFMIGCGFILIVWPWWSLPVFAVFFYFRFNKQILGEERYLSGVFGKEFDQYCQKTPRLFPSPRSILTVKPREIFNFQEAMSTKEKWGLIGWPFLAIVLELIQEQLVFGATNLGVIVGIFLAAVVALAIGLRVAYRI